MLFLGYLGLVAIAMIWSLVTFHSGVRGNNQIPGTVFLIVDRLFLAVPVLYLGSLGVGRALGEGTGAFLLTRPRKRSWFVWRDWGLGLLLVAGTVIGLNVWSGYWMYRMSTALYRSTGVASPLTVQEMIGLNVLSLMLACALLFSVVYLATILRKSSNGVILGIGALVGYLALNALLEHYMIGELPSLMLNPYRFTHTGNIPQEALASGVWVSVAIRAGILLLFPIAAQLRLERMEIAR
ncbi:hypothetical protein [Silvibacterium dinghuense]|nr:hypothetical protein [Silvibacterium dinghuense]